MQTGVPNPRVNQPIKNQWNKEIERAGWFLLGFFLVNLVMCIFSYQATMILFHVPMLLTGGFAVFTSYVRISVLNYILIFLAFANLLVELGIITARILIIIFFCGEHRGCFNVTIAYLVFIFVSALVILPLVHIIVNASYLIATERGWESLYPSNLKKNVENQYQ